MNRIAALFLCLVVAPGVSSAQPSTLGVAAIDLDARTADKAVELGTGIVRLAYPWNVIEGECKGCFNWSFADRWRDEARRTGRTIYALVAYTPAWANGGQHYNRPPQNVQDWYDFVFTIASRYRDDIFTWGIWNEPNLSGYLEGASLDAYRELVIAARMAILAANPRALVAGPEVSWHGVRNGWYAGAMHDFGHLFDIVTVHWYGDAPQLEYMMDQQVRPFARGRDVWLSETGAKPCATVFGEVGQASVYQRVLSAFRSRRAWWTTTIFYNLFEDPRQAGDCGWGITRPDWTNRPAFSLYQAFIRQTR